jgi:hypothetical protein
VRWLALALLLGACSSARPDVVISELMYHPVDEQTEAEEHEFVELHNRGAVAVPLAGWRLDGEVRYTFPAGVRLEPGQYLVVAKKRTALLAVARYALRPEQVLGDYQGELDNGGGQLELLDPSGHTVDQAAYDDAFPWPLAADALGASDSFLSDELLGHRPIEEHRFLGRSLERLDSPLPGTAVASWQVSPLDGATPGRAGSTGPVLPVLERLSVAAVGGVGPIIRATDQVQVQARFSDGLPAVAAPALEYFVDDLDRSDEAVTSVPLQPGSDGFLAVLPPQTDNAIVRYRVVGDRGGGPEVISPRSTDPYRWHAYFVSPVIAGKTQVFQLFISKAGWEALWDYIQPGRVPGNAGTVAGTPGSCTPNPYWDAKVPAVLAVNGKVYDVQTRYQGSVSGRSSASRAVDTRSWPAGTFPSRPSPLLALSWHLTFPRYNRLDKRKSINLSKLTEANCLGFSYSVGAALFEQSGIPAGERPQYLRLYVNGSYYNYVQRIEHKDGDMLQRYFGKGQAAGDLFKADGIRSEQGPYSWADERIIGDSCGYSAGQRVDATYERVEPGWKQGSGEVKKLIEDLHAARAAGVPALRKFFQDNFDLDLLASYMAIKNWLAPWDDYFHNHYFFRRADGKWMLIPDDFDGELGISTPLSAPETSFFNGRENDRSARNNWMNYLKDSYLRAFRTEFIARLNLLSQGVLHPANVEALIDEVAGRYAEDEARAAPTLSPTAPLCSVGPSAQVVARMKTFARRRYERLLDGYFD